VRTHRLIPLLAAALALAGCYAEVEDQSVSITRACTPTTTDCTFQGVPTALQALLPLSLSSGSADFGVDLGDSDFLRPEKELGPLLVHGVLAVNQVVVATQDGVALDGIETLQVTLLEHAGCDASCQSTPVATYHRPAAGPPDPTRLVLTGNPDANLLQYGSKLAVRLEASGRVPAVSWKVDLTIDGRFKARADWK
jgi:hypothetical protein